MKVQWRSKNLVLSTSDSERACHPPMSLAPTYDTGQNLAPTYHGGAELGRYGLLKHGHHARVHVHHLGVSCMNNVSLHSPVSAEDKFHVHKQEHTEIAGNLCNKSMFKKRVLQGALK
jgi:hypothetical protein